MQTPSLILATASLLSQLAAAKSCINATIPVTISARNAVFNITAPSTEIEVTGFVANLTKQSTNLTDEALTGYNTVSGTYNISTQFCVPTSNSSSSTSIQVLTHGIGFDKTYWDLPYNNFNYSYVDFVTNQGYSTLSYDRLGIGNSSHGEPVNEIQQNLEVAALVQLTQMLRNGTFPGASSAYERVLHVGHSFGSVQNYSLAANYPTLSDGLILTGFSANASFIPFFAAGANFQLANTNQPLRFSNLSLPSLASALSSAVADLVAPYSINLEQVAFISSLVPNATSLLQPYLELLPPSQDLPTGYFVSADASANQYLFLQEGHFDPEILPFAEGSKQPVTVGELLTLGVAPRNGFTGPVLVLTGETDVPFCGGNCLAAASGPNIPAGVAKAFPNVDASNFSTVIQPNTGHGINLHYNATGAYQEIQNFLSARGLGA